MVVQHLLSCQWKHIADSHSMWKRNQRQDWHSYSYILFSDTFIPSAEPNNIQNRRSKWWWASTAVFPFTHLSNQIPRAKNTYRLFLDEIISCCEDSPEQSPCKPVISPCKLVIGHLSDNVSIHCWTSGDYIYPQHLDRNNEPSSTHIAFQQNLHLSGTVTIS